MVDVPSELSNEEVESHEPVHEQEEAGDRDRQFPCHQCGANLKWTPGQGALTCPYCGHAEDIPLDKDSIKEYAFNDYLVSKDKDEGLGIEARAIKCGACGAELELDADQAAHVCPFCGSNAIDETAHQDRIKPEAIIPFRVNQERARKLFREWLAKLWFAPNSLKDSVRADTFQGLYRPWWTFDSHTVSHWSGYAGEYYYVTRTRTNSEGKTETYQERKVRWHYRSGTYQAFFDDELTVGFRDKINAEEYNLSGLTAYDTGIIAGYLCERYVVDPKAAWASARTSIEDKIADKCRERLGGDTQKGFQVSTAHSGITFKSILLPVWQSAYRFNDKIYQIRVNGQNGNVTADRPYSWIKITLLILLIAALIFGLVALMSA